MHGRGLSFAIPLSILSRGRHRSLNFMITLTFYYMSCNQYSRCCNRKYVFLRFPSDTVVYSSQIFVISNVSGGILAGQHLGFEIGLTPSGGKKWKAASPSFYFINIPLSYREQSFFFYIGAVKTLV